jgi:glutamate dehydrogenase/leucine dehydrogenase
LITLHNSVLEKEVDILVPASSALSVNEENWKRIKADIIICAANAPMSNEIERSLFYNDKIVITDFIANCGGVLGSTMDNYVTNDIILHILSTSYKRKVENLLSQSADSNKPLLDIVTNEIEKRIDTNYRDIHVSNGKLTDYMLYILSNPISYPIKKMMDGYISKRYISMYETLWN